MSKFIKSFNIGSYYRKNILSFRFINTRFLSNYIHPRNFTTCRINLTINRGSSIFKNIGPIIRNNLTKRDISSFRFISSNYIQPYNTLNFIAKPQPSGITISRGCCNKSDSNSDKRSDIILVNVMFIFGMFVIAYILDHLINDMYNILIYRILRAHKTLLHNTMFYVERMENEPTCYTKTDLENMIKNEIKDIKTSYLKLRSYDFGHEPFPEPIKYMFDSQDDLPPFYLLPYGETKRLIERLDNLQVNKDECKKLKELILKNQNQISRLNKLTYRHPYIPSYIQFKLSCIYFGQNL